jgi:hypothetical protein
MSDALATLAAAQPAHHRRHDRPFGVSVNLTHAKVARDPKPPAERAEPKAVPIETPAIVQPSIKIKGRVLAVFSDYDGLWSAVRARVDAMGITRLELDYLSGNQEGYSGNCSARSKSKNSASSRSAQRSAQRAANWCWSKIPRRPRKSWHAPRSGNDHCGRRRDS